MKQAEAAVAKAKDSGKKAAAGPAREGEEGHSACRGRVQDGQGCPKLAESAREAREAQGLAEEAAALAEKL